MKDQIKKLIIPGVIGNVLEWYDFSLYGYFAPTIAQLFFPSNDKTLSLIMTFSIFALGYLLRPLGAAFFGHFGDKWGRKKTLSLTIILMALPTTLISILPTYQQVGALAGILLTLCRMIQGIAVGGGFTGSIVYILEHAPATQRGLYGSLAVFSGYMGFLCASAICAIVEYLASGTAASEWAWRLPFLMGIVLGFVGLYLRRRMPETPQFLEMQSSGQVLTNPVLHAFKSAPLTMLKGAGLVFLPAMAFYLIFVFLSSYLTTYSHMNLNSTLSINTICMFLVAMIIPFYGYLSDKIGRKAVFFIGAILLSVLSYPLFLMLLKGSFQAVLFAQAMFAMMVSCTDAVTATTLVEMFPTNIRYSAISITYNTAYGIFGGTAPLVATLLINKTQFIPIPSFYLIFACILSISILFTIRETYNQPLK